MNISVRYEHKLKSRMFEMGSLFRSPSPPPPPPLPSLPTPDPEEEARKERLAALERRRRGRTGTILTSERGVLQPLVEGKRLLGQ
jgi:hypothetical protein